MKTHRVLCAAVLGDVIAQFYHHVLGSEFEDQQTFSLLVLRRLVAFECAYWAMFDHDGELLNRLTVDMDHNCKRRFDRALRSPKVVAKLAGADADKDHFACLQLTINKVKTVFDERIILVASVPDGPLHLLVLLVNDSDLCYLPGIEQLQFLFVRMLHALKLQRYLHYQSARLRPNSYKAVCGPDFSIIEAEKNFYRLLECCRPGLIQGQRLNQTLIAQLQQTATFCRDGIVYTVTRFDGYICVEIYYDDPRMRNLTPKRLAIVNLLYLDREAIARRLNMSIRTLDDHFAAIFDEFGCREKKKILAQTHQFPDIDYLRRLHY